MQTENKKYAETLCNAGTLLQQARQTSNLSIADVADALRLDQYIIVALENNDDNALPETAYVKGYLRSYAKHLKIDPQHVIELYQLDNTPQTPQPRPHTGKQQMTSSDRPIKAITYLVTLILVLLMLAWWQSQFVPAEHSSTDANQPAFDYPYDIVIHPDNTEPL